MEGLQMDLESMTPLIAILDTRRIAAHIFGRNHTLGRLMRRLGCPHAHLHQAGNDAMFTLKALFALAVESQYDRSPEHLAFLHEIAYSPLPDNTNRINSVG
jgi:DNA polymerase III epsilon subunit-like protein